MFTGTSWGRILLWRSIHRRDASRRRLRRFSRQQFNEFGVRGRKSERLELVAPHPSHFLSKERLWVSVDAAAIKIQFDRSLRVNVARLVNQLADVPLRSELFADLPFQRHAVRLVRIDLPAGKIPESGQVNPRLTARNEEMLIARD